MTCYNNQPARPSSTDVLGRDAEVLDFRPNDTAGNNVVVQRRRNKYPECQDLCNRIVYSRSDSVFCSKNRQLTLAEKHGFAGINDPVIGG